MKENQYRVGRKLGFDPKAKTTVSVRPNEAKRTEGVSVVLEKVVRDLMKWRDARRVVTPFESAESVLRLLAFHGVIDGKTHPMGGMVWRVNGAFYGRTDGITHEIFNNLRY